MAVPGMPGHITQDGGEEDAVLENAAFFLFGILTGKQPETARSFSGKHLHFIISA